MANSKRRRLEQLEQRANAGKRVIAVVDVCDLSEEEATARIEAKRAELDALGTSATLIILQYG